MKVIAVDDEPLILQDLKKQLKNLNGISEVSTFTTSQAAMDYAFNNQVDLAFLDIEMPEISGLNLARKLLQKNSDTQIVFTTGHQQYALDAFKLHVLDYHLKPCRRENLQRTINKARCLLPQPKTVKPFIRTFGRFELYVNDVPVHFSYEKSKELLALLVDARGGTVRMEQAVTYLWEDRRYDDAVKQLYRKAVNNLRKTLTAVSAENICKFYRAGAALDITGIECDYYQFLSGNETVKKFFVGLYLPEYSWAEYTTALLENLQ